MLTDMKILHRLGLKSSPNHCAAVATKDATPGEGGFGIVLAQPRVHSFGRCVPMQWLAWSSRDDANSPPTHTDLHGLADCRAWPPLGKSPGAGAARCGPPQNLTILPPQTILPHPAPPPPPPPRHPRQRAPPGPPAELERCIAAAQAPANPHSFVRTTFDQARSAAAQPGQARLALAGLAVSVKDLFDIAGQTTSAG